MISEYQTYAKPSQDNLVNDHLPLVKRIATHLSVKLPSHIETDDLIQVGLIGLLKAADDYQPDSGAVFSTYATIRIKGAMLDELRSRDWLPRAVQKNLGLVLNMNRIACWKFRQCSNLPTSAARKLAENVRVSPQKVGVRATKARVLRKTGTFLKNC